MLPQFVQNLPDDAYLAECRGKRIGILIVAYNAASTLDQVLKRVTTSVWDNVEEIAVFDDASQDGTFELAIGMKSIRNLAKLKVLRHPKNLGYGGNQKSGYRYFLERGFDIVVLLHGDGQYAPEVLSHLYAPLVRGEADAVFGSRMMRQYGGALGGGMPLYKYVGNRILSAFENAALGMNLSEFHSGYRAYSLSALREMLLDKMSDDFHFDTEIIIKLHHQRRRILEVPIPTYYGNEICYVDGLRYARNVVRAVWRYHQTCRSTGRYPEFEEYFTNYPLKRSRGSSHEMACRLTGSGHEVLDIGCGRGLLARELAKAGNFVDGVDCLAETPQPVSIRRYFRADLDGGLEPVLERLGGKRYDRILLLDILEHLKNPAQILQQASAALRDGGVVIVSLPNVANITVRAALLFGRFEYQERGILDRTHLRFYTRKTARRMLTGLGYTVLEERHSVMPFELVLGLRPGNPLMRAVNLLLRAATRMFPGLLGYQIILVARPAACR